MTAFQIWMVVFGAIGATGTVMTVFVYVGVRVCIAIGKLMQTLETMTKTLENYGQRITELEKGDSDK